MGCGASSQPAPPEPAEPAQAQPTLEDLGSGGSGTESEEVDEYDEMEPLEEVRAAATTTASGATPRSKRERRSSVELLRARREGEATPREPKAELDGPEIDEGVAGLVDRWVKGCVAGDGEGLLALLSAELQETLSHEAEQLETPCSAAEWCLTKNSWRWREDRGRLKTTRVTSFDGHMCGVRSSFDAGLLTVNYRDVVWVDGGAITATRSSCLLTHERRQQLAIELVEHAACGREEKVWTALAPSMRAQYEADAKGSKHSGEELCRQQVRRIRPRSPSAVSLSRFAPGSWNG